MPETTGAEASSRRSEGSDAAFAQRMDELLNAAQEQRRKRLELLQGQIHVLDKLLNPEPGHGDGADSASRPPGRAKTHQSQLGALSPRTTPEGSPKSPAVTSGGPPRPEVIEPLALADNLFGADDVAAALKIYQGLTPAKFGAGDRQWIRYQIASCHRRLGDVGTAEQEYRELAGTKPDDRIAAFARWWLDAIQKRKRLEGGLKAAAEALNSPGETTRKGVR
jgi:TolA-binding protein